MPSKTNKMYQNALKQLDKKYGKSEEPEKEQKKKNSMLRGWLYMIVGALAIPAFTAVNQITLGFFFSVVMLVLSWREWQKNK